MAGLPGYDADNERVADDDDGERQKVDGCDVEDVVEHLQPREGEVVEGHALLELWHVRVTLEMENYALF